LEWAVASIHKNKGDHEVEVCIADDASTDGTWDWLEGAVTASKPMDGFEVKAIRNDGPDRLGHTILYDRLIREVATSEVCIIFHADMYLCPGALDAIEKHLYQHPLPKSSFSGEDLGRYGYELRSLWASEMSELRSQGYHVQGGSGSRFDETRQEWNGICFVSRAPVVNRKTICSLTRIEPPLHPAGPEKILLDCGTEPEAFDEAKLLRHLGDYHEQFGDMTTEGIFAPWAFFRQDFLDIGGHDPLFAPQSKEDSDIFNRFALAGFKFVQTWRGFVYHLTCRGSRFNPTLTTPGKNSSEWEQQNIRSARNFIRKWGHYVKHDPLMKPIVPPKYNIGFYLQNATPQLLYALEPWCSILMVGNGDIEMAGRYIDEEQPNTMYNLHRRVKFIHTATGQVPDVLVRIDGKTFTQQDMQHITVLSEILQDSGQVGEFTLGNLKFNIKKLDTYEHELIVLKEL
jgi:glycosyltransferase involved in cell wall biosynthesis